MIDLYESLCTKSYMGHCLLATPLFTARDKGLFSLKKKDKDLIKFGLHKSQSVKKIPIKTERMQKELKICKSRV